jgi:hypothetical protein
MWHRYRDNGNGITVGNVFYTWNGGVSIDGSAAGKKTRAPIVAGRRLIGHPVSGTPAQELQLVPRLAEGLAGVPRLAEVPRSPEVPRPAEVPPLAETLPRLRCCAGAHPSGSAGGAGSGSTNTRNTSMCECRRAQLANS